jgi:hypothetical protein
MDLATFRREPWKTSFPAYDGSVFNIRPAPEYANGEVVVASLYRAIGFKGHSERDVPAAGREFDKSIRQTQSNNSISSSTWASVVHGILESPRLPNQSTKRFLQLCPIVPDVALYSGTARTSGNSWNPGLLIQRLLRLGCRSADDFDSLWRQLFDAISVTDSDDVWARWLNEEFSKRRQAAIDWKYQLAPGGPDLPASEKVRLDCPARQFVRDLRSILSAKNYMTRRQWVSLLEAILRLGAVTHVLWLCDVNDRIWQLMKRVLSGEDSPDNPYVEEFVLTAGKPHLVYGNPSVPIIRELASRYLLARLSINFLMWKLAELKVEITSLSSAADICSLLDAVEARREHLDTPAFMDQLGKLKDSQSRLLACKVGIGSNLVEFGQHVLGQRRTLNEALRGFDQGYFLRKKGQHSNAPWVLSLGPVAVLALVHCCLNEVAGPRSIERLCAHLSRYGLAVDRDDIAKSDLGQKLRMLGLILDSPDAESGMLLVPPFAVARNPQGAIS